LYPFSDKIKDELKNLNERDFSKSDHYIGRNISCLIKLSWSNEEVKKRASTMVDCIKSAYSSS
jgi:8-amino-3,8-dideoxy-alpha-D-manno-octulosonate transaminase